MRAWLVVLSCAGALLVPASPAFAAGSWSSQSSGTTHELNSVSFVDQSHGWAASQNGDILATSNGGASWSPQTSGAFVLAGVSFVDQSHGWAVGIGSTIRATSDGGETWIAQATSDSNAKNGVSFVDQSHGWEVGFNGSILATGNGGANWSPQTSGTTNQLFGVSFVDQNHGWAVGAAGTILATSNGGVTWSPQTSGTTRTLVGVSFVDQNHGWVVGDLGTILATSNGGVTWSPQTSGAIYLLTGVSFVDQDHGWVVGDGGTILTTTDGGASWGAQTSGTTSQLDGVSFVDQGHGWAVGKGGTILAFVGRPPTGQLAISRPSGPAGSAVAVSSVTPCPKGSSYATISLTNSSGGVLASANASAFDSAGNWRATVGVPAGAGAGSYNVTASCFEPAVRAGASDTQNYTPAAFTVPPVRTVVPGLSALKLSENNLSIAGREVNGHCVKPTAKTRTGKHCRRPIKLTFRYTLNTATTVTFTLKLQGSGRKVDGRCVKQTPTNRHKPHCSRLIGVPGSIVRGGKSGVNSFLFTGKFGGHTLGPGSYQLIATPTGGKPRTATFRIVG